MTAGWVKLHRSMFDCDIFENDTYSKAQAWMWLIAQAAWQDTTVRAGSSRLELRRGQAVHSRSKLARIFRWTEKKVRGFLDTLEAEGMIMRASKPGRVGMIVTVCKYDDFQSGTDISGQDGASKGPAKGPANGQLEGQQRASVDAQPTGDFDDCRQQRASTAQQKGPADVPERASLLKKEEVKKERDSYRAYMREAGDPFGLNTYNAALGYDLDSNGFAVLSGQTRTDWLAKFGSEEALSSAVLEIADQPIPRHSVAATIAARLARVWRLRTERAADRESRRPSTMAERESASRARKNDEFEKILDSLGV